MNPALTRLESLLPPAALNAVCTLATETPPGDFVELGVYRGGTAAQLYTIADAQGRTLHLFDTFAGHPGVDEHHDAPRHHYVGRYHDGIAPARLVELLPNAKVYVGPFPRTFPNALTGIAFAHVDMDLYAPTVAACRLLPPRMVPGGVIVFDDYDQDDCPGVREAVDAAFGPAPARHQRVIRFPVAEAA